MTSYIDTKSCDDVSDESNNLFDIQSEKNKDKVYSTSTLFHVQYISL